MAVVLELVVFLIVLVLAVYWHQRPHECHTKRPLPTSRCGENLLPLLDPLFNMRQICKHCALLEDHLALPRMTCIDCCMKHWLYLEGYAEEAITLDKEGKYLELLRPLPERIRELQNGWTAQTADNHKLSQELRKIRKELIHVCFDMRKYGGGKGGSGTCGGGGGGKGLDTAAVAVDDCVRVFGFEF